MSRKRPHDSLIYVMEHLTDALAVLAIFLFILGVAFCLTGRGGL